MHEDVVSSCRAAPGQRIGIGSLPNLRDIGGYATAAGAVVRTGLVYRSSELSPVPAIDLPALSALQLKYVFDLRTAAEVAARADEVPAGVERVWLDVFADAVKADPLLLDTLLANPLEANARVGGGRMDVLMARAYEGFVSLPSAQHGYARLFESLADPAHLPALFHCTAGKDRTGWAAAALLTLLGVPRETVVEDYLVSNEYMLPHYRDQMEPFVAAGGEAGIMEAIFGVKRSFLDAAFAEVERGYGTIEGYFGEGLGIDLQIQESIRAVLLRP
jgi:protein-tyrosine phosphatase